MIKDRSDYDRVIKLAFDVESKKVSHQLITMTEVLAMKLYCDIYLLTVAVRNVQNKPGARLVGLWKMYRLQKILLTNNGYFIINREKKVTLEQSI
jgi:hypothetical protein